MRGRLSVTRDEPALTFILTLLEANFLSVTACPIGFYGRMELAAGIKILSFAGPAKDVLRRESHANFRQV